MKKYRVEAFIIPSNNKNKYDENEIDDVKLANKFKKQSFTTFEELQVENITDNTEKPIASENLCDTSIIQSESEFSGIFFEINEHIYDEIIVPESEQTVIKHEEEKSEYTKAFFRIEEPIYDEPFVGNLTDINKNNNCNYDIPQSSWTLANSKYRRFGIVAPKIPKRTSSLKSIIEDIECIDDTLQEICCHGRKNGCLPSNQRPEDISEEIFKENWMQRLDALRKFETLLKDKEVALQSRERLLFKKEKELKILEKLVKDKMKQAELYAKRYKKSLSSETITNDQNTESRSSNSSKNHCKSENSLTFTVNSNSKISVENQDDNLFKNPLNSRSSFVRDRMSNRIGSVRSRSRPRQKVKYDDLNSTLSADVGDSSFIITSKKFNPETFKKPAAFYRSASERRPKTDQMDNFIDKIDEKMLKKISENIIASQDQETKFLNYGLIDNKSVVSVQNTEKEELANQKRFSYLNLESMNKTVKSKNIIKERPISWSEDMDDWLKKKRQAYNLATKVIAADNIEEKENYNKITKMNKPKSEKKEHSRKIFSIFR